MRSFARNLIHRRFLQRELKLDARAFSILAVFNPYSSTMGLNNSSGDDQPHAQARLQPGAEKFFKHTAPQF